MRFAEQSEASRRTVPAESVVRMPSGLLGLEPIKEFVLLAKEEDAPFFWLQVLKDSSLAFLVISPFVVKPDYEPDIPKEDAEYLGLKAPEDALVFNIVTLRGGGRATVNLKGPVVINRHTLVAKQVVPTNVGDLDLHYPLPVS